MAALDGSVGEHLKCDRCGLEGYADVDFDFLRQEIHGIFSGYHLPEEQRILIHNKKNDSTSTYGYGIPSFLGIDFCRNCYKIIKPHLYNLYDILRLKTEVNKLQGAINEKNRNHRTVKGSSGKSGSRCFEWESGDRTCYCSSQACEEHF